MVECWTWCRSTATEKVHLYESVCVLGLMLPIIIKSLLRLNIFFDKFNVLYFNQKDNESTMPVTIYTQIVTSHTLIWNRMFNLTNVIRPLHSTVYNEKREQRKVLAGNLNVCFVQHFCICKPCQCYQSVLYTLMYHSACSKTSIYSRNQLKVLTKVSITLPSFCLAAMFVVTSGPSVQLPLAVN